MKQPINEIKRMQQLAGILKENHENKNIIDFCNNNLEEVKQYIESHLIFDGLSEDEISERQESINGITTFIEDTFGDASPNVEEIGVSIKYAKDVDDDFVGEEGDKPDFFKIKETELAAVWYNV